jgi:ABC-type dipeptide/oligopeptide/nickel transport system permease subunit
MSELLHDLGRDFLPQFLAGMAVNFTIAAIAIAIGLLLGLPLGAALQSGGVFRTAAAPVVALMRAAPTFVVMFFLLNAIPRDARMLGHDIALSGVMMVALSLVPYSAAYVADSSVEALRHLRAGSRLGALLFLPNVMRAFFVLVMSSGAGAAIGVSEGISIILRQAEQLPNLGDRMVLFALGIALFGIPLQLGFAIMSHVQRRLGQVAVRDRETIT